ncbi:MAG TPA: hypothetical protein VIT92_14580 [Burkholderiaceae bacterium]
MKKLLTTLLAITRQVGLAGLGVIQLGVNWLRNASWQRLLVACIVGAMLLAIVPTALVLFLIFLVAKAIVVTLFTPAPKEPAPQLTFDQGEEK